MNRMTRLLDIPTPRRQSHSRRDLALTAVILFAATSAAFALAHRPAQQTSAVPPTEELPLLVQADAMLMECAVELHEGDESTQLVWLREPAGVLLRVEPVIERVQAEGEVDVDFLIDGCLQSGARVAVGRSIRLALVVEPVVHVDPITELIEAEELIYPWDIFDIMLGEEPESHEELRGDASPHYIHLNLHRAQSHRAMRIRQLVGQPATIEMHWHADLEPVVETEAAPPLIQELMEKVSEAASAESSP